MRLALISDVHANLEALEATLADIAAHSVDRIVCLGDIVGYNTKPAECIALIRAPRFLCIAGNHDLAVCGRITTRKFRAAGSARRRLDPAAPDAPTNLAFLRGLPLKADIGGQVIAVHGALHPETGCESVRLDNDERRMLSFEALMAHPSGARICAFGHTHRAGVYELRNGAAVDAAGSGHSAARRRLLPDQSRHGRRAALRERRATYMILDLERRTVTMRYVDYDASAVLARQGGEAARLACRPWPAVGCGCCAGHCSIRSTRSRLAVIRAMMRRNAARSRGAMPCFRLVGDGPRHGQQFAAQPLGLRGEEHPHLAPVVVAADAADQPGSLHAAQRDHGGRLHHADPRRQLPLRQPVRVPQHAQKIPLAARHAVRRDAPLQQPLKRAVCVAHQIAGSSAAAGTRPARRGGGLVCGEVAGHRR